MWKIITASAVFGAAATASILFWYSHGSEKSFQMVADNNEFAQKIQSQVVDSSEDQEGISGINHQLAQSKTQVTKLIDRPLPKQVIQTEQNLFADGREAEFDPIAAEAEEIAHIETIVQFLDDRLLEDPIDSGWSGSAESEVVDSLRYNADNDSSRLDDIRCRSTLCRLSMHHENPDAELRFSSALAGMEAFMNSHVFSQRKENADGSVETLMFVSRSGYELPPLQLN